MKRTKYGITFGIALVSVIFFTFCKEPFSPVGNGFGKINVRLSGEETRSILPSAVFDKYVYTFNKVGGMSVSVEPVNGYFTLEVGSYTLKVDAYKSNTLAASGVSSQFAVSSGSNITVEVRLSEVNTAGQGVFTYTITYPTGATAEISLKKWPGMNDITLNPTIQGNGKTQTLNLSAGTYMLAVLVNKSGLNTGVSEAIHIKPEFTTAYTKDFVENDLLLAQYTVTFNANGASGTTPTAQTIGSGSSITLPDGSGLSKTGYTFDGWNTKADGTGTNYNGATSYTVTNNVTLYAKWIVQYTVTFNANGASGSILSAQTVSPNSSITLPGGSGLSKTGYSFDGWNTNANGMGTNYNASTSYTVTGNVTLYAKWVENVFTSITALKAWLSAQPYNSIEAAYTVKVNISDLGGDCNTSGSLGNVIIYSYKYVNLDLSGSTFTNIPHAAFTKYESNYGYNTYTGGCTYLTSIILPNSVTGIYDYAFCSCTNLTSVTIPNSVTGIARCAFSSCTNLTSISIPNSVKNISWHAFSDCTSLTSITFNATSQVTYIDDGVFQDCTSLTSVTIPNSVTSIKDEAFKNCTSLTSVTIPNSVTSIGQNAFNNCDSLTNVTIPNSVTSIGGGAFNSCYRLTAINVDANNTAYSSQDGVLYDKNKTTLISFPQGKTGSSFIIPNSVTSIGNGAFLSCFGLTSVTIPNSVTSIGSSAFYDCSLNSVTFQGIISSSNFNSSAFGGDLRDKYLAGGVGMYTRFGSTWTKQ
jgi:uncharacterized repeat protein (TIGR02543 family)